MEFTIKKLKELELFENNNGNKSKTNKLSYLNDNKLKLMIHKQDDYENCMILGSSSNCDYIFDNDEWPITQSMLNEAIKQHDLEFNQFSKEF